MNVTECTYYDDKFVETFKPCFFPYTTRAAAWNFDYDDDGSDVYKCDVTYAQSTGNLHLLSCVIYFSLSIIGIAAHVILYSNNRAITLTRKTPRGSNFRKTIDIIDSGNGNKAIKKLKMVYVEIKALVSLKLGVENNVKLHPLNFMQKVYLNLIPILLIIAFGSIDRRGFAGRLPLIVHDGVYNVAYSWLNAIGFMMVYEWGTRVKLKSKYQKPSGSLSSFDSNCEDSNTGEAQGSDDKKLPQKDYRACTCVQDGVHKILHVFLDSTGPNNQSILKVTFHSTLVLFSLSAAVSIFSRKTRGASYWNSGVYDMELTCYMYYFQGVLQLGYCIMVITFGWALMKELQDQTHSGSRDLLKTKRYYAVFTFIISLAFIMAFLVNMNACVAESANNWIHWMSPPCSVLDATFCSTDYCVVMIYLFLITNCGCKKTLPAEELKTQIEKKQKEEERRSAVKSGLKDSVLV